MASIVCSVDVERPVREVYERWSRIDELPLILSNVVSIRRLDERTTRWVVRIAAEQREFDAVVTEEVPSLRMAWKGLGVPHQAGVVTFHRLSDRRSRMTVQLDWEPAGLFDRVGDRLGLVQRAVRSDLQAFKRHVEGAPVAAPAAAAAASSSTEQPEAALGRAAERPTEIPAAGWKMVLKRTFKQLKSDNVPVVAGGVAYYAFLALVPALAAIVSIYGIVADPSDVGRQLESFFGALPRDAADLLREQVESITSQQAGGLGLAAVVGILASLWSASKGMQAMIAALNIAYDEEETRKGLRLRAITLGMTVFMAAGIVLLIALMIVAGSVGGAVVGVVRWPVLFGALVLGLALLYRYAPDRDDPAWRWITPGAAVAGVLVVGGSFAFATYVNNFGKYSETYGSLGAIVVLLLWLNLTAYVVVLGAELDAELERQTARDTTRGAAKPLGAREAHAADTVAG
jgi:membrane protein